MGRKNQPVDVFKYINTHDNDPDVCWEWTGHLSGRDGRPYFRINYKNQLAYRVVFEIFNGPLEFGMVVRHKKCDNPVCCNPEHLRKGTRSDNERDKYQADRAGIPNDIVKEIRRITKFGVTYKRVQEIIYEKYEFKVSTSAIGTIFRGDRRAHDDDKTD